MTNNLKTTTAAVCKKCGSNDLYREYTVIAIESIDIERYRGDFHYNSVGDAEMVSADTNHFGCRSCGELFYRLADGVRQAAAAAVAFTPGDQVWLTNHHSRGIVKSVDLDANPVRVYIEGFADWFPAHLLEALEAAE